MQRLRLEFARVCLTHFFPTLRPLPLVDGSNRTRAGSLRPSLRTVPRGARRRDFEAVAAPSGAVAAAPTRTDGGSGEREIRIGAVGGGLGDGAVRRQRREPEVRQVCRSRLRSVHHEAATCQEPRLRRCEEGVHAREGGARTASSLRGKVDAQRFGDAGLRVQRGDSRPRGVTPAKSPAAKIVDPWIASDLTGASAPGFQARATPPSVSKAASR